MYRGIEKNECPQIKIEEALEMNDAIIIDVRTPSEYKEAHVYNSINIPLMDDYQRHIVGKTYKQESQEAAIELGWKIFEPVVKEFFEKFKPYKNKKIIIYCWRGGMRSRIVTNLLKIEGFNVVQMIGGYKRYLNKIIWEGLDRFAKNYKPKFLVLFGNTGTRKTEILKALEKEELPIIDLEGLAKHRGSVYGAAALNPRSQKMFSTMLYHKLDEMKDEPYIFIEGESHKIGNVYLPEFVTKKIKGELKINVKADIKTRVKHTVKEYFATEESIKDLYAATPKLEKLMGKKNVNMLINMLDNKEYNEFTEWLLINYYDKRYFHGKMNYSYNFEVSSDDLKECVEQLKEFFSKL